MQASYAMGKENSPAQTPSAMYPQKQDQTQVDTTPARVRAPTTPRRLTPFRMKLGSPMRVPTGGSSARRPTTPTHSTPRALHLKSTGKQTTPVRTSLTFGGASRSAGATFSRNTTSTPNKAMSFGKSLSGTGGDSSSQRLREINSTGLLRLATPTRARRMMDLRAAARVWRDAGYNRAHALKIVTEYDNSSLWSKPRVQAEAAAEACAIASSPRAVVNSMPLLDEDLLLLESADQLGVRVRITNQRPGNPLATNLQTQEERALPEFGCHATCVLKPTAVRK